MIRIHQLTKTYGSFAALRGISFEARSGEVLGLLGPNGAGKTTTMRIMTGFLAASSGEVVIDGLSVATHPEEAQKKIGYLPENTPLYPDLTVFEHLDFAAEVHGIRGVEKERAIRRVCDETSLTDRLHFTISELSKGYRQRVGLAQALIHDPAILILDEPTTGLDPNQILEIRELIRRLGEKKTIILSTHIMQEVEAVCDRVVMIAAGEIVAEGAPDELTERQATAEFQLRVVVASSVKAALDIVKSVSAVKKVTHTPGAARGTAILTILADEDPRAELMKKLTAAQVDLLELALERQTMEDVFTNLTK